MALCFSTKENTERTGLSIKFRSLAKWSWSLVFCCNRLELNWIEIYIQGSRPVRHRLLSMRAQCVRYKTTSEKNPQLFSRSAVVSSNSSVLACVSGGWETRSIAWRPHLRTEVAQTGDERNFSFTATGSDPQPGGRRTTNRLPEHSPGTSITFIIEKNADWIPWKCPTGPQIAYGFGSTCGNYNRIDGK